MSGPNKRTKYGGWDNWYAGPAYSTQGSASQMRVLAQIQARKRVEAARRSHMAAQRALMSRRMPDDLRREIMSYVRRPPPAVMGPYMHNGNFYNK